MQHEIPRTLEERTIRFTKDDLEVFEDPPCLNLDDISENAVYKYPGADDYILVSCTPSKTMHVCPYCNTYSLVKNGNTAYPRLVHDVNIGLVQVDLSVTVPRYKCNICGQVVTHSFTSLKEGQQFTNRLYEQIKCDAFTSKFSDVAQKYGIATSTVELIFDESVKELESRRGVVKAPKRHLAIDEKHVGNQMRGVFVDGENGNILEITETNDRETVKKAIMSMDGWENISIVTTDMANGYRPIIEELFGQDVKLVVDKFHVLKDLSVKINQCRKNILDYLTEEIKNLPDGQEKMLRAAIKKLVAENGYLFKFSAEKVAENNNRAEDMALVCSTFPEFEHLRRLKEEFELIYQCDNRENALTIANEWAKLVPPSGAKQLATWENEYGVKASLFEPMKSLKKSVLTLWKTEIFNYFDLDYKATNAIAEASNSFIERLVINSYKFSRLRAKALYWYIANPRRRYIVDLRTKTRKEFVPDDSNFSTSFFTFRNSRSFNNFSGHYETFTTYELDGICKPDASYLELMNTVE